MTERAIVIRVARQAGLVVAVRRGGAARHAQRRALRLCRRPARDQRPRQLPAEHHHPPARPRRPGDRRVRHRAPRRHRLRRHGAGAADRPSSPARTPTSSSTSASASRASSSPRSRTCSTASAPAPARSRSSSRGRCSCRTTCRAASSSGRDARLRAQDQGGDRRDPAREALHQARDLHLLRQP